MTDIGEQAAFRMPATGEAWREHTDRYPSLFTIIGMANDDASGAPLVVFTDYEWSLAQLPAIRACALSEFIALVPDGRGGKTPRFRFEREAKGDPKCPFIAPRKPPMFMPDNATLETIGSFCLTSSKAEH